MRRGVQVREDRALEGRVRYRVAYWAPGPNLTPKGGAPELIDVGPAHETEEAAREWATAMGLS